MYSSVFAVLSFFFLHLCPVLFPHFYRCLITGASFYCIRSIPVAYIVQSPVQFPCLFSLFISKKAHLDSIANLQYLPGLAGASHIMRLRQMALDCQADKPGVFLQLRGMLNSCLIPLFAREAQGCEEHPLFSLRRMSHEQQLVLSCMKYINDNVTQNTTVAELCEQFHVSQSYLYRCFSHILHCSPNNWIRRYRIGKSLSSLRFSDRSISQTAEEFGFSSVYHYSRVFKEVMGKSPSIYRRALLAENQVT